MKCSSLIHICFGRFMSLTVIIFFFVAAGCGQKEKTLESTLEQIKSAGVVRIGYANEAPYAYYDNNTGRLTGEAPEIAREIFGRMGVNKVEGVLTEFSSLIPGLKAKRFDIIAAGMYITPKRCKEIAFSNPTYKIGEAFLVKKGNPLDLHSYEDVAEHPESQLGVVAGAVELGYARATGVPDNRISVLPDTPSAVAALQADRIDAYAGTSLTINNILSKLDEGNLEKAVPFTNPVIDDKYVIGYGAFGVRKEDKDLIEEFNKHLKAFIGSVKHRKIVEPFEFTESELPGNVKAEELCKG